MPKYEVIFETYDEYKIIIDADSPEEAESLVNDDLVCGELPSQLEPQNNGVSVNEVREISPEEAEAQ